MGADDKGGACFGVDIVILFDQPLHIKMALKWLLSKKIYCKAFHSRRVEEMNMMEAAKAKSNEENNTHTTISDNDQG